MYPPIKATASDSKAATISSSQFAAGSQSESVKPNNGDWASESPMFRAAPGPRLGCAKDAGRPTRNCAGIGRPPPLRRRWAVVADQNFEAFRCQRLPRQGSGRDIAEALVRANYGLRLGKFELDFADGEVGFQVSQILVDEAVGQDVIDRILGTTVNMLETYLPGLLSVSTPCAAPHRMPRCSSNLGPDTSVQPGILGKMPHGRGNSGCPLDLLSSQQWFVVTRKR
jgi:hypothetical protein